jgi:hypothetical protein
MNTLQLENLLRSDCKLSVTFEGVFASDLIPTFCGSRTALVLNESPQSDSGTHWIGIYIENGKGEYFDSYGRSPEVANFVHFLDRNCPRKNWRYNEKELQSYDTDVCGQYCIWFISERARGKSMNDIVSTFSKDTQKNDVIVKERVETRFGRIAEQYINIDSCANLQCCIKRAR